MTPNYEYRFTRDDGTINLIFSHVPVPELKEGYWHSIDSDGKTYSYRADTVRQVETTAWSDVRLIQDWHVLSIPAIYMSNDAQ